MVVICSYTVSLVNFRYQLLQAMVANDHEVVALGPENHAPTVEALARIGVAFHQIPMARAGLNPFDDLRSTYAIWRFLRAFKPDVVVSYTMKPIIYGLVAARLAGVPERHALITGLGYIFGDTGSGAGKSLVRRVVTLMYRVALKGCGRVFVYNEADEGDVRNGRMLADQRRIVRVPGTGVDFRQYPSSAPPRGEIVFLMIARLLREKGIWEFIDAARALKVDYPNACFRVLGPMDPSPLAVSRAEIDRWSAENVFEYLGETSDVRPYLADCSVFVLPSYYREGIPRSILEALATGRAVITADTPGCRDTVEDGENGFIVPPRDASALAEAMRRFLDQPALVERMGRASLAFAKRKFDIDVVNQLLLGEMHLLSAGKVPVTRADAGAYTAQEEGK